MTTRTLFVTKAVGDGVGDSLTLAPAGRAEQYIARAALGSDDGSDLRGTGRQRREQFDRVDDIVDGPRSMKLARDPS
ncbi:hypothetical protein RX330_10435 [Bradyrhizobium sp. NDS-1]|uniref:hypothetical protein n=1 Tax=Bradyrhizobium sp. NDS-1 TaxID=3080014 RepID=UPI00293F440F|nr:hypothetical protein [Bradyrhizobium sp. NDS-1]WOH75488.1 hypothetical protein RX330_10435 [Bradyrhizobium sp. NDS-1]